MAFCPNCGHELARDSSACPACGASFGPGSAWQPTAAHPNVERGTGSLLRTFLVRCVISVAVSCVSGLVLLMFAYGAGEAAAVFLALWWIITIALIVWTVWSIAHHAA